MTPENTVKVGGREPSAYFRAMETAATQNNEIIVQARGIHVAKANDVADGFTRRYESWTIKTRVLDSIRHNDRSVTEATIILTREETQ